MKTVLNLEARVSFINSGPVVCPVFRGFRAEVLTVYEGCSNMNASSFITFFTYMLRQKVRTIYDL